MPPALPVKGFDEVLFINEEGNLLEGAISNLIIKKNEKYFTPPTSLGLLRGCYTEYLIEIGECEEKLIKVNDLIEADEIYFCNSVIKKKSVIEIQDNKGKRIY